MKDFILQIRYKTTIYMNQDLMLKKQKDKIILVTVGTTKFQSLIQETDTDQFVNFVTKLGFSKIIYQIGLNGQYIPSHGQYFRTSPSINTYYSNADLIITHGGAGTLLQNLINKKLMISVANDNLMNNHQTQIIEKLGNQGYILGFSTIQHFSKSYNLINDFILNKNHKQFKRNQQCLLNKLVFND